MILLRAIPFSFAVLWRMVLVFPFMILGMIVFGIIAVIFMVIIGLISPIATLVAAVCFGVAISVLPVIIGSRLALQAKECSVKNSYFGLLLPAIGYGLFEAFCLLLIVAASAGIYLVATPLSLADLEQLALMDEDAFAEQLMAVNPAISLSLLWVGGVLTIGLRAALLMPFAGASIGADPSGRAHTPFFGFGNNFLSMLFLVAISYILWTVTVPIVIAICYLLGFGETLTVAMTQLDANPSLDALNLLGLETAVFLGLTILFYLWSVSLQAAGGALAYVSQVRDLADQQNAFDMSMDVHLDTMSKTGQPAERPIQPDDVMELIRSRMKQNKR